MGGKGRQPIQIRVDEGEDDASYSDGQDAT